MTREAVNSSSYHVPMATPFTQAVRVRSGADLLFLSGITARDEEGAIQWEGDTGKQADWIFRQIGHILAQVGATFEDVAKLTIFVRRADDMATIRKVKQRYFRDPQPASTTVEVSRLFDPLQMVEIEAVAVVPDAAHA